MNIRNEKVAYENPLLPVRIFQGNRNKDMFVGWHYHKELELLLILEGTLDVYVDEEFYPLQQGDVLLIGASQLHRDRSYADRKTRYICFQFDLEPYFDSSTMPYYRFFTDMPSPLSRLNYIFRENEAARRAISSCMEDIFTEAAEKKDGYEIAVGIMIRRILLTLLRSDESRLLKAGDHAELLRLKPVLDYVESNLTGKIQVESACKIANISYYYFVKLFKRVLGMSFVDYVNYNKIKRAERILLTKDLNVAQVGEAIGMPNMAHFYKIFRKYNQCSPNEFRRKMLKWQR